MASVCPGGGASGDTSAPMASQPSACPTVAVDTTVHLHLHLQHSGHNPLTTANLVAQPPHPRIAEKVADLIRQGASFPQLEQQLAAYADVLVDSLGVGRNPLDGRFYPRAWTIHNLYNAAMRKSRAHSVDQEACEAEMHDFEHKHPRAKTFFRKRSSEDKMLLVLQSYEQQPLPLYVS